METIPSRVVQINYIEEWEGDDPPILESLVGRFRLRKGAGSLGQTAKKSVHGILLLIGERVLIDTAHAHAFTNCHVRVHIWT